MQHDAPLADVRGRGIGTSAVALPGISALMIEVGRTAHSKPRLPMQVTMDHTFPTSKGVDKLSTWPAYL